MKKNRLIKIFLFLFPILIGLQILFPKSIQLFIITIRLILLPLSAILILKNNDIGWLVVTTIYFLCEIIFNYNSPFVDKSYVRFISVLSILPMFMLGKNLNIFKINLKPLAYGTISYSAISITIFIMLFYGILSIDVLYEKLQKSTLEGIFRYSLGNPIEVPLAFSCIVFSLIIALGKTKLTIALSFTNLVLAIISQSRLVIIISLFIFLLSIPNRRYLIILLIIFMVLSPHLLFDLEIFESIYSRYLGEDQGSFSNRKFFFSLFKETDFNVVNILFGHGYNSSFRLNPDLFGYKSLESSLIELFYEFGLFGTVLTIGPILMNFFYRKIIRFNFETVIVFFIIVQTLMFLPIFSHLGIIAFSVGMYVNPLSKIKKTNVY